MHKLVAIILSAAFLLGGCTVTTVYNTAQPIPALAAAAPVRPAPVVCPPYACSYPYRWTTTRVQYRHGKLAFSYFSSGW